MASVDETIDRFTTFLTERGIQPDATDRITIIKMATLRCILDTLKPGSERNYQASLAKTREEQHEYLWLRDRLDTPWALLVDQEFPGAPLDADMFTEFAGRAGDRVLESYRRQEEFEGFVYELVTMAAEAGYSPRGDDYRHLVCVASLIKLMQETAFLGRAKDDTRKQVEEEIAQMSQPDHPVWRTLLELYFPEG